MADDIQINAGAGPAVATDDVSNRHFQLIKPAFGVDGAATLVADAAGSRLPVELGDDSSKTLQASQTAATSNGTTTRTTTTGLGKYCDIQILINITNGGAATGTLQLFLEDSFDGGTTWNDLVASNNFTFGAPVITQIFSIAGRLATTQVQGSAAQQETLTAGNVRQGPWGDRIRVREKVSGVSGSPTGPQYTITAVFKR